MFIALNKKNGLNLYIMKKHVTLAISLLLIIWTLSAQISEDDKKYQQILSEQKLCLKKNKPGEKKYYSVVTDSSCNKSYVKYLGKIKTAKNNEYKILTSFYVIGQSCRGNSKLIIYNNKNIYQAHYWLGLPSDLPDTIINNELVYLKYNKDYDFKKNTKFSFKKGLPKELKIPADSINNDIYSVQREE